METHKILKVYKVTPIKNIVAVDFLRQDDIGRYRVLKYFYKQDLAVIHILRCRRAIQCNCVWSPFYSEEATDEGFRSVMGRRSVSSRLGRTVAR